MREIGECGIRMDVHALPFRIIKSSNEKKRTAEVAHNSPMHIKRRNEDDTDR